ncbi:PTS system sorbose subfamily IIB component [Oleidesulfovibrio alaskensis G20]|jgi:PTS system mannose-specific IIB component|uniref:PTS system sorbose subfamily IIB component n=1 Tax=Oleidesulfovibrio alaskensis (strain ATCC BAA-1058 / DSM 17464 / G20) TaxID=207559 RepID=Q310S3_OLEA2|nr:PTS sugar transporter subunit IIB [Oleidesulfovibrio alaskensis]ABB38573.1 PTS system sorbose subfamily IIB component [Oleidesulfovibrio alaskensis G20]MBG0774602.1 PTS sugar transporter subunit IIB [Oleidesulfovibrio alaskensis]MBL3581589.1 PTS sugar transporter subunit IIB [Oleidesulfovibrio alaskensis]MBL3588068.1 PTS sugar transporter subunit IIB [bacterium]
MWVRVDNRLVHGQIIETWLPYTGARHLLVVNDELAADDLQQQIVSLAVPGRVSITFVRIDELQDIIMRRGIALPDTLVLFANCGDARRSSENGFEFDTLNIGNLHYSPGKRQLCPHVAVSDDDEACLRFFKRKAVALDFRCVPNAPVQVKGWS